MIGAISVAMDTKADMNIVEFSYDISGIDSAKSYMQLFLQFKKIYMHMLQYNH
jgi:hypothetical protein